MKHCVFILFAFYLLFVSCQRQEKSISPEEMARQDSLALHVAVIPVIDCLPIYYAQRMGLFSDEGVDVRLKEYNSQMDCDTAIIGRSTELAYADVPRVLLMKEDVRVVMGFDGKPSLVTARSKRLRQLKHLDERMVALSRLSTTDYWSDELTKRAGLAQTAIYRPQINDIFLRTSMLTDQLVDAALLPEPFATLAERKGNLRIFVPTDSTPSWACLAVGRETLCDTTRNRQIQRFFTAYEKAVIQLNSKERNTDTLRSILCTEYALPYYVADSLRLPKFRHAHQIKPEDVDVAMRWLQTRERIVSKTRRDSLFCKQFVN